jgi:hypothetical protein
MNRKRAARSRAHAHGVKSMLYRWEATYYPGAPLLNALKREVSAEGGRVIEWDEPGGRMMLGISGPNTLIGNKRLQQTVYAYQKSVRWYSSSGHRYPGAFENETRLAVEEFERRMREAS